MGVWAELAEVDVLGITGEGENEGCREAVVTGLIRRAFGQNLYSHPVISSLRRNQEKLTLSHSMMHLINVSISFGWQEPNYGKDHRDRSRNHQLMRCGSGGRRAQSYCK